MNKLKRGINAGLRVGGAIFATILVIAAIQHFLLGHSFFDIVFG